MIQLYCLLLILVALQSEVNGACLNDWVHYKMENKCYKLFVSKKSWNEAKTACAKQQSKLAEVKNFNTNTFLQNNFGRKAWIGSYLCGGETCFLNGEYVPYTPYAPDKPDMKSDQPSTNQTTADLKESDFAILIESSGWWADELKHNRYPYICELPGVKADKPKDDIYTSCKNAFEKIGNAQNGIYKIKTSKSDGYTKVYCQMTTLHGCSRGGWTLVMKADGNKETFKYDSELWSNRKPYNLEGGQAAFDNQETKLPTYWSMPFKEICLGMKVNEDLKFISIPYAGSSMYDVIANGTYRRTNITRSKWLSLVHGSELQPHCDREGFNLNVVHSWNMKVRIGIQGNEQDDCRSPDSFLGFGGLGKVSNLYCRGNRPDKILSVGNVAYCTGKKEIKEIPAMGYIFVQ